MSAMRMTAAAVTLYAEHDVTDQLARLVADTAFRLDSIEPGPVPGTVTCLFVRRRPGLVVGGGNLVDLAHRIQRNCEIYGAHRVDDLAVVAS